MSLSGVIIRSATEASKFSRRATSRSVMRPFTWDFFNAWHTNPDSVFGPSSTTNNADTFCIFKTDAHSREVYCGVRQTRCVFSELRVNLRISDTCLAPGIDKFCFTYPVILKDLTPLRNIFNCGFSSLKQLV